MSAKELSLLPPLPRTFYGRDTLDVARDLLGKVLIRDHDGSHTAGRIVEAEAYRETDDPSAHSYRGQTKRNQSMFGPEGHAYVYTIHAKFCFNIVCCREGIGDAVLIRALQPIHGLELMRERRAKQRELELARGPARLCQAMAIDREWDGWDLAQGDKLWIANDGYPVDTKALMSGPRVGISKAQDYPWRFAIDTRFASLPRHTLTPIEPENESTA